VLTPLATVITDISIDHAEILGDTIELIAAEKAGIVKPGVPNVIGLLPPAATRVFSGVCRERRAPLVRLDKHDFSARSDGRALDFRSDGLAVAKAVLSLPGNHQIRNAALVLKTLEVLRRQGIRAPIAAIKQGLRTTTWPGRFDIRHFPGLPVTVLDVCHNKGGAEAFARTFEVIYPGRKCRALVGFVKRKDHQGMIDALAPIVETFHLAPLPTKRTIDVAELIEQLDWRGVPVIRSAGVESGFRKLLKSTDPDDIIAIIGSHYLVGAFLAKHGR
jgi:dihydrofolate synthase/folylpolyglutamate synthase